MLRHSLKASYQRLSIGVGKPTETAQKACTLKQRGYAELKQLGKGSFGQAILVLRKETNEHYVAKCMRYRHLVAEQKEFILREVETMRHISTQGGHPYLVRFRESFVLSSGKLCIIMDFCDGGDLAQHIAAQRQKKAPFQEEQVCPTRACHERALSPAMACCQIVPSPPMS